MKKTILTMLSAATLAVLNCFAGDNLAEIEAALAREAQSKPRLKAARMLSATGDDNTYWATGELNVTKSRGTISLQFDIPKAYTHITSATLTMNAYDVDYTRATERDEVYFNNTHIGRLVGGDNVWNVNTFSVPASAIHAGINNLRIEVDVDNLGWVTRIEYAKLVVDGVVDYIKLKASSNFEDKIKLSWDVSSGLFGAHYSVYRSTSKYGPFYVLPKADGIRARHFYDTSCLAGVNYYYYVDSRQDVKSDLATGRRAVKIVEPKFQLSLEGTDWPSTKGLKNEDDILVAGHVFKCRISAENPSQTVSIKKVELVGRNIGGAASKKDHKIVWTSDGSSYSFWSYATGWVRGQTWPGGNSGSNALDVMAVLKSGPGYHGSYSWNIEACEYEMGGKAYKAKPSKAVNKNVYFERDGIDNAERSNGEFCKIVPNWFAYWRDDGACPGLRNSAIIYRGQFAPNGRIKYGGAANSSTRFDWDRKVWLDKDVADMWQPITVNNPNFSSTEKVFFTWNGVRRVYGIYKVEDTVAHEWQHHATAKRYNEQISAGKIDSDKQSKYCAVNTGMYALCDDYTKDNRREICDGIVDDDETGNYFIKGLNPDNPDTYGLGVNKNWSYGGYGDNELVSMVAGRNGMHNANPYKDWAYPGEQSGGIPLEATPSYRGTRTMAKSLQKESSLNAQSDTNLIISINSVAAAVKRDQNSITGIVYTIGISVQGDELVDFNGYLFDAQSNVVATTISSADANSDSIELFFDSRNIFDNGANSGPFTLGRVDIKVDDNFSTNNIIGVLHDFAVAPIEIEKNELICNKAYILTATDIGVSESGIDASISILVNVTNNYQLIAELVNTNGDLVATATVSNTCAVGTNTFALVFSNDSIFQSGVDGFNAVRNLKLWSGDELIDADAGPFELPTTYRHTDFVPSNSYVTVDLTSEGFLDPDMTEDGKLSSLKFYFDVTNGTDETISYDVSAVLFGTNTEMVASTSSKVNLTNGVNHVEIIIPASTIAASNVDGPFWFRSVELQPQDENACGATFWPKSQSGVYKASDFGNATFEIRETPQVAALVDYDRISLEYSYDATRTGEIVVEAVLVDKNGDFAARVINTNDVAEIGIKTNIITITCRDITGEDAGAPYAVANISLRAGIDGEMPVYANTEDLTNIYWRTARCFVDANAGSDSNDGRSWDQAYKTISYAIPFANSNNTIAVKSGLYSGFTTGNSAITITAVDGPNTTIIDGGGETRCANLGSNTSQTNTVLVGFSLRNGAHSMGAGAYGGTLKNCIIENCRATQLGGGACYSVLEDCQLRDNAAAQYGGGAFMATLRRCHIVGNKSTGSYGGGIMDSGAHDCIIQRNEAATHGGGAGYSRLYNCTVIGNSANRYGGGVYAGTAVNSIIWGNTASISNNHYRASGAYNCTTPCLVGDGNIESDPLLRGAEFGGFMLSAGSPCIDAGLDDGGEAECDYFGGTNIVVSAVSAMDFFGQERMQGTHVDMGAVEGVTNACLIMTRTIGHGSLDVSFELLEPHSSLTITADESIRPIDHFETNDGRVFTGSQVQLDDITSDTFLTAYFKYYDFYVDVKNGNDENDGFSWATAKRTLQSAIDSAVGGEKIMVAKGMYEPILTADKAVVIESVSGASLTFINGGGTNRCANLLNGNVGNYSVRTNTVIVGFTLMNGRAASGAGACGGTLHDCVIKSNVAADSGYCYGGGTYYGVQYNCRYEGNSVSATMCGYGGAAYYGTSHECIYANNSAYGQTNAWGGATYYGTHYDCDINHNTASRCGGGAYGGTYYRTVISENEAPYGGGCGNASFYDGEIKNNVATSQGGGVYNGNIYRSVISKNTASGDGGGVYAANLTDCTIENNLSSGNGGGALLTSYTATRCAFLRNRARSNGGGVYGGTCNYCGITNNIATSYGGGAYNITGSHTTIASNRAASGGGICNGTYNFCTLEANISSGDGGGAYYGTFNDSLVSRNEAQGTGGGLYRSTFYRTRIVENTSYGDGGGVYNGTGYNSLIVRNKGLGNGGGTYSGYNYNCTITENWCGGNGGGTSSGNNYNTIIVDNTNPDGEYNRDGGSVYNCLSSNAGDPLFVNPVEGDYRLRVGSSCINAGNNSYANGSTDIALATRIQDGTIDMGAYEGSVEGFVIAVDSVGVGDLEYGSSLVTNGASFSISAQSQARAFLHFLTNGVVATTLPTLTLDSISSDVKVTAVFAHEMFVDGTAGDDGDDGLAWATAKKTIQAAIDDSAEGDTIWVADGVYEPIVAKDRMIEIVSVNGPGETIIDGGGSSCCAWLGNEARYQFANDTRLSGFTLRNGYASYGGGVKYGRVENCIIESCHASNHGGGTDYSMVSNCVIRNNTAEDCGGGAAGSTWIRFIDSKFIGNVARTTGGAVHMYGNGTFSNCSFESNIAGSYGGALYNGIAYDSTFTENRAAAGGATYNGTFYRCSLSENTSTGDGGGAYYGTFYDSTISNNYASGAGGGSYRSTYWRSRIMGNVSNGEGGGVYNGTGYSSLIARNKTIGGGSGGGTSSGYTYNCTVYGNYTGYYGGGSYNGYHYNSIIWGNENGSGANDTYGGSYYSCKTSNPMFVDAGANDFRIRVGSPCLNAGNSSYVQGSLDLLRDTRVQDGTIDIGACEGGVAGFVISVDSIGKGDLEYSSCVVAAGEDFSILASQGERPFLYFQTNGVVATTSSTLTIVGVSDDLKVTAVFEHELFVDGVNGHDGNDGFSWATAKKTIQAAINVSLDGDTIWVADGVYDPIATSNRRINVVSANGREKTVIDGGHSARCVTLGSSTTHDASRISGFTIRNGYSSDGGGVRCGRVDDCVIENCRATNNGGGVNDTTISNCVVRNNTALNGGGASIYHRYRRMVDCIFSGNSAQNYGGGAYGGTARNCSFTGNVAKSRGGGMSDCFAYNSTVSRNRSPSGGGVYEVIAYNSAIFNNTSTGDGGGAYYGTLYDSVISNNTSSASGGGLYRSTYWRCRVVGNTASSEGGGIYNGTGYSSLIAGNRTNGSGGGTSSGYTCNCTITENYNASSNGGGTYNGYHYNSLIWGNSNGYGHYNTQGGSYYSCKTSDPLFVNASEGDYRLRTGSPCINAGSSSYVQGSLDLARNIRVQDGTIDVGAYEGSVDGYVITIIAQGIENVSHSASLVESNGTFTVYGVTGTRPFVGIYTNKVFASSTIPFTWTGICADGELTVEASYDLFVDANEGDDANDGLSRGNAKQSIQAAIDISMSGDVIHVADGWYEPFSSGNMAIRIKSDNGPDNCIVYGDYLSRCATLGSQASDVDTVIEGLTLSCGYSSSGGGCCYGTAVDCIIEDCYSTGNGGGAYGTMLSGSSLVGNVANSSGGGSYGNKVIASSCIFEDNISYGDGGGAYNGAYYDCTFAGNRASSNGGATYDATLQRCIIRNNQAAKGGGTHYGTSYSSLYHDNYASSSGGGAYQGALRNCTVTRNKSVSSPAGVYNVTAYNTIVWGNYLNSGSRSEYSSGSYYYCCLNTTSTGTSTLASDPLFVDADSNDFRLSVDSPCLNRGSASYVSESTDLSGNARTQDGTVDIGCYEGAFSDVAETRTTPEPVPYSWLDEYPDVLMMFGGDYEAMANAQSPGKDGSGKVWPNGSAYLVWQDYVAGTGLTDDNVFTAKIEMLPDGTPNVTWEPDTPELRATRTYTTYGKKTLLDRDWTPVTDFNKDQYHFFKVEVKMK